MDLDGATILLTGGTGSFGNAFVRRILSDHPGCTVRVYSRDELKQSEMAERFGSRHVRYFVGDIRNRARLTRGVQGCDFVVHAAAMKQVGACEYNPFEAVNTNILGSQHVVDASIDARVGRVIALSTDKAVYPANLYGATKLCAEKLFVQGNAYAGSRNTKLACVRYGNVVGSRGSVIPVFRRQRDTVGRLTITDERMTRFWITLDQAVDLVFHAMEVAVGGEVFIPKIPSTKITDVAEAVAPGLPYDVVGIRPGEKLHESLLTAEEARHTIDTGSNYVLLPEHDMWSDRLDQIEGKPVDESFTYASNTNDSWMSIDDLRTHIEALDK
jgi:UDP-N-acetylglucosamine 4,6-dehydratase